jgi:hypothetical protein
MISPAQQILRITICILLTIVALADPAHALTYPLTLSITGTGSGSLYYSTSTSSGNCNSSCIVPIEEWSLVSVDPRPDSNSLFAGWSSGCTLTGNSCGFMMTGPKSFTATLDSIWPVIRFPSETPFTSIQSAYNDSATIDNSILQTTATTFNEEINCSRDILITLKGGYDDSFSSRIGYTTIDGSLSISAGTVVVEYLAII